MALDSNLFTLSLQRRLDDPAILDLIPIRPDAAQLAVLSNAKAEHGARSPASPNSTNGASSSQLHDPLYTFSRARTASYNVQLIDAPTQLPLASMTCLASTDRIKTMQLLNPDEEVDFEKKGNTFRQEWKFSFADNDLLIRRDGKAYIVVANRKPDPEIDIVRYTPPYAKNKLGILQVLDYNIQRLEVNDRRGLEIVSILAVCHCLDQDYDEKYKGPDNIYTSGAIPVPGIVTSGQSHKDGQRKQAASSEDMQGLEPNEIVVPLHTPVTTIVEHALSLLRQDSSNQGMHMIVLRAQSADTTTLAVRVAAEIKARWYKLPAMAKGRTMDPAPGSTSDVAEELYQYVRDRSPSDESIRTGSSNGHAQASAGMNSSSSHSDPTAGPRGRIKLDAPKPDTKASSRPASSNGPASKLHALIGGHSASSSKDTPSTSTPSPEPRHSNGMASPTGSHVRPSPSQLAIYLCKDRIDEFERETRTLGDSVSAARMAQMLAGEQGGARASTSSPDGPTPSSPPPHLPPKTQSSRPRSSAAPNGAGSTSASPSPNNSHSSPSHSLGPHRFLNKLGIRTQRAGDS